MAAQIDFFLRKERGREARFFDWVLNSRERESARTGAEFVRSAETSVMHGKWMLSFAIKRPVILRRPSGTQPTSGPNVRLLTGHKRHSCREGRWRRRCSMTPRGKRSRSDGPLNRQILGQEINRCQISSREHSESRMFWTTKVN